MNTDKSQIDADNSQIFVKSWDLSETYWELSVLFHPTTPKFFRLLPTFRTTPNFESRGRGHLFFLAFLRRHFARMSPTTPKLSPTTPKLSPTTPNFFKNLGVIRFNLGDVGFHSRIAPKLSPTTHNSQLFTKIWELSGSIWELSVPKKPTNTKL